MGSAVDRLSNQSSLESTPPRDIPWVAIGWFAVLVTLCYVPVLRHLFDQWISDDDMGHGLFVPVVAGYVIWQRRHQILTTELHPNYWGVLLVGWGAVQLMLGTLGAELFLQRTALLFTLVGLLLVTGGGRLVRILTFPLVLLIFMIPIPAIIFTRITFPLQLFASSVAEWALNLISIPVLREGNVLELPNGQKLSVVEACSGIRSLLSLTFLSLVYSYFFDSKPWMRVALLATSIPIAIAANAGRVTITGILSEIRPELAQGFFHSVEGWLIFAVAFVLLIMAHNLINLVYRLFHGKASSTTAVPE